MMKKMAILALFVVFISVFLGCENQTKNISEYGVVREFSESSVKVGESVTVKLHINLKEGQTYYLIDETVPNDFEIVGEHENENRIKIAVIQDAKSTVYEYIIKAIKSGEYFFDGEYVFEGMETPAKIIGDNRITVK
jgi:uncharacterized lipoprotein NlpE involved in copper resistance